MPSRYPLGLGPTSPETFSNTTHKTLHNHRHRIPLAGVISAAAAAVVTIALSLFLLLLYYLRRRRRRLHDSVGGGAATPSIPIPLSSALQRLQPSVLRRATASFCQSRKIGHGGFGPVYLGYLPPSSLPVAIKVTDSSSLQGDREFLNELSLSSIIPSGSPLRSSVLLPCAFSLSSENPNPNTEFTSRFPCFRSLPAGDESPPPVRRSLMLVYDLMPNGSLQDALLGRKLPEIVSSWPRRFSVALDIARALHFLHEICDPPIIHGDVKPSNVLLDPLFSAKLADFGLARVRSEKEEGEEREEGEEEREECETNDCLSELATDTDVAASNPATSTSGFDRTSVGNSRNTNGGDGVTAKDWWWHQDNTNIPTTTNNTNNNYYSNNNNTNNTSSSNNNSNSNSNNSNNSNNNNSSSNNNNNVGVKDYVMEWIKSEIKKERPKKEWWTNDSSQEQKNKKNKEREKEKAKGKGKGRERNSSRRSREWWREEFTDELSNKHKNNTNNINTCTTTTTNTNSNNNWWLNHSSSNNNYNNNSTVSSTPSMRGTVCYVAPEYGGGAESSEKCDIYSYGVLLLVIVSGRRPLQVAPPVTAAGAASPVAEFERASLVSWARHLARSDRLIELVDQGMKEVSPEQVILCLTVALMCIQRAPASRPMAGEIVGMLTGERRGDLHLPVEFSPSPPGGGFSYKYRKKKGR